MLNYREWCTFELCTLKSGINLGQQNSKPRSSIIHRETFASYRMASVPETVQVAVRIRPLSEQEQARGCQSVVTQPSPDGPRLVARDSEEFTFSEVFGPAASQTEVYERSVRRLVLKLFEGYNVCILAYGQTGSGKTYTIGTSFDGHLTADSGILPRALLDIFKVVNGAATLEPSDESDTSYRVICSFMEIYQENVYDLFSHRNRYERLVGIRESSCGIIVPGLTEVPVSSAEETFRWLVRGSSCRAMAPTSMNKESNRSHTIFTVMVRKRHRTDADEKVTIAKLHFVDLAGSERTKKSHASGDRLRETIQINKALLALGNVISTLASIGAASKSAKTTFVSYRDSKLTRLLQNSLGGNSITLMLACVSPANYNIEETLSTLRYADRALSIRNKPTKITSASSSSGTELERLSMTISQLRSENEKLRRRISSELKASQDFGNGGTLQSRNTKQLIAQNRTLHGQLQSSIETSTRNELRASIAENALGRMEPLLLTDPEPQRFGEEPQSVDELRTRCSEVLLRYRNEVEALHKRPTMSGKVAPLKYLNSV
ncbi:chromosome-associated kinesin KIF4-like [Anopheles darlingi]|uniref:chromosome-associated kinesin KIF4-like n=1 Tax=Anopheles darlingi TaxID=43151 RepID=UPI00210011BE|nr:chromosome-associated kinesin KIF4-like [Anopheles darlingi]